MSNEETCPHLAPIQVTLDLLEGDLTLRHTECGLPVAADRSHLRAHGLPLTLTYVVDDADEDWLELGLPAGLDEWLADEQPQDAQPGRDGDGDVRAAVTELRRLRAEDGRLAGELLRAMGERDAHRRRQIEAERALIVLLAREGGSTEFTPAELTAADYHGSFVSSRDVATGNERLKFVTAKPVAAPQQPERGGEANCNPECREAHAGQPH